MTLDEATRILLHGTTQVNASVVCRATGVNHQTVWAYMRGRQPVDESLERIYLYVWRRINAHVLLSPDDVPCACADHADAEVSTSDDAVSIVEVV